MNAVLKNIFHELREHAPFTIFGTVLGVGFMAVVVYGRIPDSVSKTLFEISHPAHVFLSAIATAAVYRLRSKATLIGTLVVGYFGSVGVATLSDSVIPFVGEWMLGLPERHVHLEFIEMWWLVNPLALFGILIGAYWPHSKIPHAGHVLLSMWASLFHMSMALGDELSVLTMVFVPVFLFLAVWLPCCTSDIVFPLLFAKGHSCPACAAHSNTEQVGSHAS